MHCSPTSRPSVPVGSAPGPTVPAAGLRVRRGADRGHADHGWLDTRHTFSFADYDDPEHRGFRALRVLNEDVVAPGAGFPMHPHRDMEILTYVLEGALAHRDTLGNGSTIRPGEVQRMSAGRGLLHSEVNPSADAPVHFLQVWLHPDVRGLVPSYAQRAFPAAERADRLRPVATPDGADGSLTVATDARVLVATLGAGRGVEHLVAAGRHAWVQVARGGVAVLGHDLRAGDGLAVTAAGRLPLHAGPAGAEVLVFDLA